MDGDGWFFYHTCEFHFLLAALAVGMDFLIKNGLSIISDKQQVLIAASGCTFEGNYSFFH